MNIFHKAVQQNHLVEKYEKRTAGLEKRLDALGQLEKLKRFDVLVEQMAASEGVTEQLKAVDQMLWVRKMNGIRARAEEIVLAELIYHL